jgi:glutamate-1-semialdehyde 2,1-aminomutase
LVVQAVRVNEREVLERFESRTRASARMYREASKVAPGGVMAGIKYFNPYPIFMKRAEGSRVWDVDGNEYVDYLMSYGALVLGHGHRVVKEAVESLLDTMGTTVFGTPTEAELRFGATLRDLYHPGGLMRFTNSGLEATLLSVRLARAYTGRSKVAKFEGHYHGAVDRLLFSYSPDSKRAGDPEAPTPIADSDDVDRSMLSEAVVLPFNDWENTEKILTKEGKDLACVIVEPFEEGVIPGELGFMRSLRNLTRDLKIPLIYDEVKTGFRVRLGGATEFYAITPDIACLGKIIGGGLPIGAVVGDANILAQLEPSREGKAGVFHSGTFNGNPLSVSVGMATVNALRQPGAFDILRKRTDDLKRAISSELSVRDIPHRVMGEGGMFNVYLTPNPVRCYRDITNTDLRLRRFLDLELITNGVYLKPANRYCLSTAHTAEDIRATTEKFSRSLDVLTSQAAS